MQGVLQAPTQRAASSARLLARPHQADRRLRDDRFYLFIVLLPLYWMFRSSISENDQMYGTAIEFFPSKFTLAQFDAAINKWRFGLFLSNSIAVGAGHDDPDDDHGDAGGVQPGRGCASRAGRRWRARSCSST